MAAERFAGGRGIALDTQTSVNVKPARKYSGWCDYFRQVERTAIPGSHQKHGEIPPTSGHGR